MISLIQRVSSAEVKILDESISKITNGILAFVAIEEKDTKNSVIKMIDKIINYRIFSDENDKMNLSLQDISGELLLVSQFTLLANTTKGRRPSFTSNPDPKFSQELYNYSIEYAKTKIKIVEQGKFGMDMKVILENDGPVTFWLET